MKAAIILGAGFSKNSGIPVQSEIPDLLIADYPENPFEQAISLILKKFMQDTFGYEQGSGIPALDDIFTCIDISTNSGHHLGIRYSPITLRAVRRFLVYRVFSILEKHFQPVEEVKRLISKFEQDFEEVNYVVLNWDTVLEKYFKELNPEKEIDYCNGGKTLEQGERKGKNRCVKVLKTHGSSNWLYCDNCRTLFNDMDNRLSLKKKAGFQEADFELLQEFTEDKHGIEFIKVISCQVCENPISSHIATFSYRKSFRANSFPNIWDAAEEILADADQWIFIGYSLPDGDYEFKHLLKIAELKLAHRRKNRLKIEVILFNSDSTVIKYKKFFGSNLESVFNGGIGEYLN